MHPRVLEPRELRVVPGLRPARLAQLVTRSVERMSLDLSGRVVLTEAATGAYAVTPVIAALAGARRVHAWTRETRYGSVDEVISQTEELATELGVWDRIVVSDERRAADVGEADVVTNSGHVRPIDEEMVDRMRPNAVVPLMFEAWEIQAGRFDLDLASIGRRCIAVAGTNERHPAVDVFSYLGIMAVKELLDAGIPAYGSSVVVVCDNDFAPYIARGLTGCGATVRVVPTLHDLDGGWPVPDAVLVAMRPTGQPVLDESDVDELARHWPSALVVQYWGDVDRTALRLRGLPVWPVEPPPAGHMAVLPSDVGPDAIVRLQAGGLKVAELLLRGRSRWLPTDSEFVDEL